MTGRRCMVAVGGAVAVALAACSPTERPDRARGVVATDAWARLADSGATSGAYVSLRNADTVAATLVGASSPWARATEVHETMQHDGVAHMQARPSITLAVGDSLVMQPGGLHIMLIDLSRAIAVGDSVPLTLRFASGDSVAVLAPVRTP